MTSISGAGEGCLWHLPSGLAKGTIEAEELMILKLPPGVAERWLVATT
jgi:hypothetical protein